MSAYNRIDRTKDRLACWASWDYHPKHGWINFWPWRSAIAHPLIDAIEWCERVVYCHHNARVLGDMETRLSHVLCHVTNRLSKPYYPLDVMIAEIDDAMERERNQAVLDFVEDNFPADWATYTRGHVLEAAAQYDDGEKR